MSRTLRGRVADLEQERRGERGRPVSWGYVVTCARLYEERGPDPEREAREAEFRRRALAGEMGRAEIYREFPPDPGPGPITWNYFWAFARADDRAVALVNRSRKERGLPTGLEPGHPDWPGALRALGLDRHA